MSRYLQEVRGLEGEVQRLLRDVEQTTDQLNSSKEQLKQARNKVTQLNISLSFSLYKQKIFYVCLYK